jgi:hypothetical protein
MPLSHRAVNGQDHASQGFDVVDKQILFAFRSLMFID